MRYWKFFCFGLAYTLSGQIQHSTTSTPAQVCGLRDVVAVAAGGIGGLAAKSDGTVWEWYGQSAPTQVSGLSDIVRVAAGVCHYMALRIDGTVWEWEPGPWIAPVAAPSVRTRTPYPISGITDVVVIAAGETRSMAVQRDGTVWEWTGRAAADYCGAWLPAEGPLKVSGPDVVAVSVAYEAWMHTLFDSRTLELKSDGTVWAWHTGDLGSPPVQIYPLNGIVAITAGPAGDVALKSDGTVWEWDDRIIPMQVSGLDGIVAVANGAAGGNFAPARGGGFGLALKQDGSVWAWGSGTFPVQVEGLSEVAGIAAAGVYAAGSGTVPVALSIKRDGTVWAWGETWNARLGDGDNGRCTEATENRPGRRPENLPVLRSKPLPQ